MLMNPIEKLAMNNPIRAAIQRRVEAPLLEELGGRTEGLRVLEVGCGRGIGTEVIFERFGARHIQAIDLDPDMVRRARRRLSAYLPERLNLAVGDATRIEADDATFDAVFNFAILHHVPDWQAALKEIARVLKPGGRFFFEEVTTHALDKWSYKAFFKHPSENRFTREQFVAELSRVGMPADRVVERGEGDFIFGVGLRQPCH